MSVMPGAPTTRASDRASTKGILHKSEGTMAPLSLAKKLQMTKSQITPKVFIDTELTSIAAPLNTK